MAFKPYYGRNIDLVLGDEDGINFKGQLRSVTLTPDTNVEKIKTLAPAGQFAAVDDPEWDLELGYLYGRDSENQRNALSAFLIENQGREMPFEFTPVSGEAGGYSGMVTIVAGPLSIEQGSFSEQDVTLPLTGQPERVGGSDAVDDTV